MATVTRREWVWVAVLAALVMAATTVPYAVGFASQTDEWRFGGFLINVEDSNAYLANMWQGAQGEWLFHDPYSSELRPGALLLIFYLALGRLAGQSMARQLVVFHGARVVLGFLLLLVSYRFLAEFLPRVRQRQMALGLVALGGGVGWLLAGLGQIQLLGSLPVDFYSPEAFSFLTLYLLPHLAAARCLWLLACLAYWRRQNVRAGGLLLGMSLLQPLYVLPAWTVLGADTLAQWWRTRRVGDWKMWGRLLAIGLLSAPYVGYTILIFSLDPVLRQWNAFNQLHSPHPVHYLLAYGVLLALAVVGWRAFARRKPNLARFALAWVLVVPVLIYGTPTTMQRRLIEGFQLPLVAAAVWGLTVALRRWRWWILIPVFSLTLPTSAMLLVSGVGAAQRWAEPIFRPVTQLQTLAWLRENAQPHQVVLCSYLTGNILPAYTPLIAYIGYEPWTASIKTKRPRVIRFYQSATSDVERLQLLADGRITYVIFGPHERAYGDFNPDAVDYLQFQFANSEYLIYKVVP